MVFCVNATLISMLLALRAVYLMEKALVGAAKIAARFENKVASDEKQGDATQV